MKVKLTNMETGEVTITDNFYIFEFRGIRNVNDEGVGENHYGEKFKIKFIEEE